MAIKRKVFYSFHFNNDVFRVQQVRNMGVIEGNEPVQANTWEEVKRKGEASIKNWIDNAMTDKSCVVVLIGQDTHQREWVKHEIKRAWELNKGLLGIYIHNLKCPKTGTCTQGPNPFAQFEFKHKGAIYTPAVYNPTASDAYNNVAANLSPWIEKAVAQRN